jgi:hypothetical protein
VPVPLPTTVPDQAAQLAQAADKKVNSVDFVIDTMELEEGKVPWRFATGTNWYKYTSPEGEFSILMLSSVAPEYATSPNATRYDTSEVHLVSSTFPIPMLMHTVVYYDLSKKTVGDEELTDFLDKYPFTDTASIIRQTEIELDGYRGREFVRRTNSEGETDVQFDMRTRVYVVENTVYEISVSAWDPEEVFGGNGNRFLDSFTLSTSSN